MCVCVYIYIYIYRERERNMLKSWKGGFTYVVGFQRSGVR